MVNLHLFMAIFWLAMGTLVLSYHFFVSDDVLGREMMGGIPYIWLVALAFFLVPYNLVRWYNARSLVSSQQAAGSILEARRHRDHAEGHKRDQTPDPNFNFSDRPNDGKR